MTHRTTYWCETPSPVGPLLLAGDGTSLSLIHFQHGRRPFTPAPDWMQKRAPFDAAVRQLEEYFTGRRRSFELARRVGNPRASRAVGLANGSNPLPIVVPCHRVIGSNGSLTGFGGGLDAKRHLLALEGAACVRGHDARC